MRPANAWRLRRTSKSLPTRPMMQTKLRLPVGRAFRNTAYVANEMILAELL